MWSVGLLCYKYSWKRRPYKLPVGFVMAALWNRAGRYILLYKISVFFFFFRLVSAVGDWMPICP